MTSEGAAAWNAVGVTGRGDTIAEERHFLSVKNAFGNYTEHSNRVLDRIKPSYDDLDPRYSMLVPDLTRHFSALRECIAVNGEFLRLCADIGSHDLFVNQERGVPHDDAYTVGEGDMDKVRMVLRCFVRDWSNEGLQEREDCYSPLLRELAATFPVQEFERGSLRVLVPGSGLSRLPFEIRQLGFCTQGNECSVFMLMASDFVLNRMTEAESHRIYPFVHQTTNVVKRSDMIREVRVPDVCPLAQEDEVIEGQTPPGDFSMVGGDFIEVYHAPEQMGRWNCVVTCFFIDTGRNIFEYLETIYHVLPIGGHWLNLGPLLYHFADTKGESSIELALDDLRNVVIGFGFDIVREETSNSTYTTNSRSMLQVRYSNAFFHAVKTGRSRVFEQLPRKLPCVTRSPEEGSLADVSAEHTTRLAGLPHKTTD